MKMTKGTRSTGNTNSVKTAVPLIAVPWVEAAADG